MDLNAILQQRSALVTQYSAPQSAQVSLQDALHAHERLTGDQRKAASLAEISRIIGMPICGPLTGEELEEYCRQKMLARAFNEGERLHNVQACGLLAYERYGGLLGPIGVGWGKTMLMQAIANEALCRKGHKKAVLHLPSHVLPQLLERDLKWCRYRIPMNFPIHVIGGRAKSVRRQVAKSDRPGLYIFPYSNLSAEDAYDLLMWIHPTAILLDEAHYVANRESARTRRLFTNYIEDEMNYELDLCGVSGTITDKSIMDYYHIAKVASKNNCPLPMATNLANEWATVIDSTGTGAATGPIMPLIQWAREKFPTIARELNDDLSGFRRAYKLRLNTSPCCVSSGDADIKTSLTLHNVCIAGLEGVEGYRTFDYPGFQQLRTFMSQVEDEWISPSGDNIDYALHKYRYLYELSAGFYNRLVWPEPEDYATRKGMPESQAEDFLYRAKIHHAAQQIHMKEMRQFIEDDSSPGLDTPLQIHRHMHQHVTEHTRLMVSDSLFSSWMDMKDLDFEGRPQRDREPIRICQYKVNDAASWAQEMQRKGKGGIIWCFHKGMRQWMYETLVSCGVDAMDCPAGTHEIEDENNSHRIAVASISGHGTGKNLQFFQEQYFLQWPRSPKQAEQTLGRLHRVGQKADELTVRMNNSLEFDHMNFAACLTEALYIHQTVGNRQKIVIAGYDPLPKIFPPEVLKERGFGDSLNKMEMQAIMHSQFAVNSA